MLRFSTGFTVKQLKCMYAPVYRPLPHKAGIALLIIWLLVFKRSAMHLSLSHLRDLPHITFCQSKFYNQVKIGDYS